MCFRPSPPLFNFLFVTLCMYPVQAQPSQPSAPQSQSACSVKRSDNDNSATTELAFSGRIRSGANYRCELIDGLTFQLLPRANGWQIAVFDNKRDDNLAGLTPVLNGQSPLSITGSDLKNMFADSNSRDLAERKFIFSPD